MSDPSKPKVWSEQASTPVVRDGVSGAEVGQNVQIDDTEKISDSCAKAGVILESSCLYCGRQWKAVVHWPDISFFFLGQPVNGTQPTKQGIRWPVPCRCGRATPAVLTWEDVKRWVDSGVRMGCLKPTIYGAANTPR